MVKAQKKDFVGHVTSFGDVGKAVGKTSKSAFGWTRSKKTGMWFKL